MTTNTPVHICSTASSNISIELSIANHSAWNPFLNCSLSQCTSLQLTNNDSCVPSTMPCFDYRTTNGTRYCAPAFLCSLLQPCDVNGECSSGSSVCIINACCGISALCLPLDWTNLCSSVGKCDNDQSIV